MPDDTDPTRRRLDRRPEATSFAVDDLLLAVRDGRVRVPPFQRKMRWDDGDRLALFDSIYRGFPIGMLLFWKRSAPAGPVQFGPVILDAEAMGDALWVIDGQPRVTTLVTARLHEMVRGERAAHFDVNREEFIWLRVPSPSDARPPAHFVPVPALLDSTRLMNWLLERATELGTPERSAAREAGKRLREYRIPGYVVESRDEELLREIFECINRSGHQLTDVDVFHALYDLDRGPRSVLEVGQAATFPGRGSFDEVTTLRALQAVEGLPVDHPLPAGLGAERMRRALGRTRAALNHAQFGIRGFREETRAGPGTTSAVCRCDDSPPLAALAPEEDDWCCASGSTARTWATSACARGAAGTSASIPRTSSAPSAPCSAGGSKIRTSRTSATAPPRGTSPRSSRTTSPRWGVRCGSSSRSAPAWTRSATVRSSPSSAKTSQAPSSSATCRTTWSPATRRPSSTDPSHRRTRSASPSRGCSSSSRCAWRGRATRCR